MRAPAHAFTFIELLAVLAIAGLVASLAVASLGTSVRNARWVNDVDRVEDALRQVRNCARLQRRYYQTTLAEHRIAATVLCPDGGCGALRACPIGTDGNHTDDLLVFDLPEHVFVEEGPDLLFTPSGGLGALIPGQPATVLVEPRDVRAGVVLENGQVAGYTVRIFPAIGSIARQRLDL